MLALQPTQHHGVQHATRPPRAGGLTYFRGRHAFTLIELLVTISIISLMIAILLPALSSARTAARTATCLSGIRQLGLAFQSYALDNDGYYPRRRWSDIPGVTTGYIWPAEMWARGYVPDIRMYSCPQMELQGGEADYAKEKLWLVGRPVDSTVMNQFFWQATHYGYNVRNIGSNFRKNSSSGWTGPSARLEDIDGASNTLLLADTVRRQEYYSNNELYGAYNLYDQFGTGGARGGLHARHNESLNIQWADGHASNHNADPFNPYEALGEWSSSNKNIWSR